MITNELAKKCKEVVGVDFSEPLLEVANRDHRPANVSYQHLNVLMLEKMSQTTSGPFSKTLMFAALQHFRMRDLISILENCIRLSSSEHIILLGHVPDKSRKWNFYNTPKRKLVYVVRKIFGRDAIGTWWDKEFIKRMCHQLDLQCQFHGLSKKLHSSRYRFDVTIY
jgi:2-polyprenyl-3-methyl-5-hydroxy-6-metoxy-1,4-benzoquinol methylase